MTGSPSTWPRREILREALERDAGGEVGAGGWFGGFVGSHDWLFSRGEGESHRLVDDEPRPLRRFLAGGSAPLTYGRSLQGKRRTCGRGQRTEVRRGETPRAPPLPPSGGEGTGTRPGRQPLESLHPLWLRRAGTNTARELGAGSRLRFRGVRNRRKGASWRIRSDPISRMWSRLAPRLQSWTARKWRQRPIR